MMANRPKMPMPDPLSATTTAAAWLAWTGEAIGLVQVDSDAGVEDDGPGVAEAEVDGTGAAGAAGTAAGAIPPFAAGGAKGVSAGAGAGRAGAGAGAGATRGAAGATGCAGAGAGAGAGAFCAGGGAGAGVGTGAGFVGAGEPDDGGAMGAGDSVHCCSGRQAACAAPAAPATTVKASMAAVIPGSNAPRKRLIRIMEVPLQPRRTLPRRVLSRVSSYVLPRITKSPTAGFPAAARSGACAPCPCQRCSRVPE